MLEAKDLTKRFGERVAIDRLTLTVEPGEIFCLLGPNGAGKTTTINVFLGFTAPTSGVALVDGIDVVQRPLDAKQHLAYIPEQVALYRHLSGAENLTFFASLSGVRDVDAAAVFQRVGLSREASARRVSTYSKGMRQKVGIAIALATEADVLLLDEPTAGLDPTAANEFSRLLEQMRERGATVLMVTHDLFRAKAAGTTIGIMHAGRLKTTVAAQDIDYRELDMLYRELTQDVGEGNPPADRLADQSRL